MTRADEDVLRRPIQPDRAPSVGADLGERDELGRGRRRGGAGRGGRRRRCWRRAGRRARRWAAGRRPARVRTDPDQEGRGVWIRAIAVGEHRQDAADWHGRCDDRRSALGRESPPRTPARLEQASTGRRTEGEDRDREGCGKRRERARERTDEQPPPAEPRLLDQGLLQFSHLGRVDADRVPWLDIDPSRDEPLTLHHDSYAERAERPEQQQPFDLCLAAEDVDDKQGEGAGDGDPEQREDDAFQASVIWIGVRSSSRTLGREPPHGSGSSGGSPSCDRRPTNIVASTNRTSPMPIATNPSATAPRPPIARPPGDGSFWRDWTYAAIDASWSSLKANFGIVPGPILIASTICVCVAWCRSAARFPPPMAFPAPVAPWQAAQFAIYSRDPSETSPPLVTFGISGPSPSDATTPISSWICSLLRTGSRRTTGWPGADNGMRPVRR